MLEFCFSKVKKKNEKEYCYDAKNFIVILFYVRGDNLVVLSLVQICLKRGNIYVR